MEEFFGDYMRNITFVRGKGFVKKHCQHRLNCVSILSQYSLTAGICVCNYWGYW